MTELILTPFDWAPELPRGLRPRPRVRWALEEAGLPYRVETLSISDRGTHLKTELRGRWRSFLAPPSLAQTFEHVRVFVRSYPWHLLANM